MSLDTALAFRIVAHELRSPAGVAQGYVRMLLEDRIAAPADRRRALEQIRDVLGRLGHLGRELSEAANWLERVDRPALRRVDGLELVERAVSTARSMHELAYASDGASGPVEIAAVDETALESALSAVLAATAREIPGGVLHVRTRLRDGRFEIVGARADRLSGFDAGPDAPGATPLVVERGGLGLSLVTATLVLDAHRAAAWTIEGDRAAFGIRIPLHP